MNPPIDHRFVFRHIEDQGIVEKVYEINDLLDDKKDIEITIGILKEHDLGQRYIDREERNLRLLHREIRRARKELKVIINEKLEVMKKMLEVMKVLEK